MKLYVAAPLTHWPSARKTMSALRSMGHEVSYDWTLEAEEHFAGTSQVTLREVAERCIDGTKEADVGFFLLSMAVPMQGTWGELGSILAQEKPAVVYLPELHCHPSEKAGVDQWVQRAALIHHPLVKVFDHYDEALKRIEVLVNVLTEARRKMSLPYFERYKN